MKNALNYYYSINSEDIHQNNNTYHFKHNGENYYLLQIQDDQNKIRAVYEMHTEILQSGLPCHRIITNNINQIVTIINNIPYILLKSNVLDRGININDLLYFNKFNLQFKKSVPMNSMKCGKWDEIWAQKIDYFEYQINQIGKKFPLIRESFSYYAGLTETAIQLVQKIHADEKMRTFICHKRVDSNENLTELYNPLTFVIDTRVRDIAEYYKSVFFTNGDKTILEDIKKYILYSKLSANECILLLARLLFPSYYFDLYEQIILDNLEQEEILKITEKNADYEKIIKELYIFIKSFQQITDIEWLMKI